mmetsp:Transcript_22379/g.38220  ORF Transcript_22379/g.38220 Transcript_22379/m.38220 type:complete len:216 (-) Transcript_22379:97-744(-)
MPLKLFGKAQRAPGPQDSIRKLQGALEMLEKREDFLQKKIQNELRTAKKNAVTNKRAAMMALKRKATYEGEIEKLSGARLTIEQQLMTIEGSHVSLEAMNAMRMGAQTMKVIHNHMTVEQVDDTMDEIREQMDVAAEINEAISQPLGGELFDEADLESQLEALAAEAELEDNPPVAQPVKPVGQPKETLPDFPSVPVGALSEEEELKALQAEMGF